MEKRQAFSLKMKWFQLELPSNKLEVPIVDLFYEDCALLVGVIFLKIVTFFFLNMS